MSLFVVAALLGVVGWLWAPSLPWWLETLRGVDLSSAFRVASTAHIVDVVAIVVLAIASVLLGRAQPSARVAKWLAIAAAALALVLVALPYVLPNPYAGGSWVDDTYRVVRAASALLQSAAMIAIARRGDRAAAAGPRRSRAVRLAGLRTAFEVANRPPRAQRRVTRDDAEQDRDHHAL